MDALVMTNISFRYSDTPVLRSVSLRVEQGMRIGVLGKSGSGKSTLLKLIAGLYQADEGEMAVMGDTVPALFKNHVALVMQHPILFPTSIRENITCGHEVREEQLEEACHAAQLSAWLAALPDGLETEVGERGSRVSGGQAQRITIARAILKAAPLVLLDEATSALDREAEEAIHTALRSLTEGKTVLSVTHRPDTLRGYDKIYRLEEGKLAHENSLAYSG